MTNLQLMSIQLACSMSQVSRGYDREASDFSYLSATWDNRLCQVILISYEFSTHRTFSHSHTAAEKPWGESLGVFYSKGGSLKNIRICILLDF